MQGSMHCTTFMCSIYIYCQLIDKLPIQFIQQKMSKEAPFQRSPLFGRLFFKWVGQITFDFYGLSISSNIPLKIKGQRSLQKENNMLHCSFSLIRHIISISFSLVKVYRLLCDLTCSDSSFICAQYCFYYKDFICFRWSGKIVRILKNCSGEMLYANTYSFGWNIKS